MPVLPWLGIVALGGILAGMLAFVFGRRAWRALGFRRRDRFREYWFHRMPSLLAGEMPRSDELRVTASREMLESILVSRWEAAEPEDRDRLLGLTERSGLLGERIRRAKEGTRWDRLESVAVLGQFRSPAAVPVLLAALEDSWPPLASAALRSLGMIRSPAAGPAIIRFLERGGQVEPSVWLDAAAACVVDPAELLRLARDDRPEVRALAARALTESPRPASYDSLHTWAFHPDPEVRAQVARALGRCADPRAVPLLAAATQDEVWFVRLRAVAALAGFGAASSLNAVLRTTQDPNFQVRQRASGALASLSSNPGEMLEAVFSADDPYAVQGFLSELARAGLLWRTLPLLRDPDARRRRDAEKLVQGALAAGFHPFYLNALEIHPEWRVRMAVARLLATTAHPALTAELERGLTHAPTPRLRRLLRAVLCCQPSAVGEKSRDAVARTA